MTWLSVIIDESPFDNIFSGSKIVTSKFFKWFSKHVHLITVNKYIDDIDFQRS